MISNVTTGGLLATTAARHAGETAIVFPGTRQTYGQLAERAEHWGRRPAAHGVDAAGSIPVTSEYSVTRGGSSTFPG